MAGGEEDGMAKTWVIGALVAAGILAAGAAALAAEMRSGDDVTVTGTFADMLFAAGDTVKLSATNTDDSFAAGDTVTAQGGAFDHLYMAGDDVSFQETTAHDFFAAGGDVDLLSGQVQDDFVAAGGDIKLAQEARIGGDAVMAGGDIEIKTPIGGQLRAAGGTIQLNSEVTGDVYLDGGEITIGPDAHIHGSFTHRGRTVTISPQAQIDGQTIVLQPRHQRTNFRPLHEFVREAMITFLIGLVVMAVVVAMAFPQLVGGASKVVRQHPLRMLAFGLLLAIFGPVVAILLMVTVIGFPLGLLFAALLMVLWPLGVVSSVYALSMMLRDRLRAGPPEPKALERALWAGAGMIVLIAIGFAPWVGAFAWIAAYVLGIGAVAVHAIGITRTPAITT